MLYFWMKTIRFLCSFLKKELNLTYGRINISSNEYYHSNKGQLRRWNQKTMERIIITKRTVWHCIVREAKWHLGMQIVIIEWQLDLNRVNKKVPLF